MNTPVSKPANAFGSATFDTPALISLARAVRDSGYHFTTVTPATHARVNARAENGWARHLRDVFGWSRPFQPGVVPPEIIELMHEAGVMAPHEDGWRSLVRLSSLDGELFVHSAFPTTEADSVFFGPDTARLVEAVLAHLASSSTPIRRAVDIGCGSGAGAVAIAKRAPGAEVVGVDINPAALAATRLNARLAGVSGVTAQDSNMLDGVEGSFDLIVSNPPFMVDPGERAYRNGGGRLGSGLPLAVVDAAIQRLAPGGSLVLFTGSAIVDGADPFREEALTRLQAAGLECTYREADPDVYGEELDTPGYSQADRIALVVLTARRGAG